MNDNKDLIFLGSFFPSNRIEDIWTNSKGPMVISADTFQKALLRGWAYHNFSLDIITLPCVGSFPQRYRTPIFKESKFKYNGKENICLGFLNLTYIKRYSILYNATKFLKEWVQDRNGQKIILVYGLLPSYLKAALSTKKVDPNVKIVTIVLDLPEYFGESNSLFSQLYFKWFMSKRYRKMYNLIDAYILLTKQMVEYLMIKDKPYVVIEGIYDNENNINVNKSEKKAILYTGKLDKRFGLEFLLEAFNLIKEDYELWICGEGSMKSTVLNYANNDRRIKYYGLIKREDVLVLQKKATLLINPRRPDAEYTKYSFPSKTMEYMASGTPTVMYHLPCIPPEYDDFLIYIPDISIKSLCTTVVHWCSKKQEELNEFGERAKQFILKNKNSVIQTKKIIDLIEAL